MEAKQGVRLTEQYLSHTIQPGSLAEWVVTPTILYGTLYSY